MCVVIEKVSSKSDVLLWCLVCAFHVKFVAPIEWAHKARVDPTEGRW